MSFNPKYYRKLRRQDPERAEAYRNKNEKAVEELPPWKRPTPIDENWYHQKVAYKIEIKHKPTPEEKMEYGDYYNGEEVSEPMESPYYRTIRVIAPIEVDGLFITERYWVYLLKKIEDLTNRKDYEGICLLEDSIPVMLYDIPRKDISDIIRQKLEPPLKVERLIPESDFDAEQF